MFLHSFAVYVLCLASLRVIFGFIASTDFDCFCLGTLRYAVAFLRFGLSFSDVLIFSSLKYIIYFLLFLHTHVLGIRKSKHFHWMTHAIL